MKNFDVIRHIYPDAIFSMIDDDLAQITWVGQQYDIPTTQEIANAISEIEAAANAKIALRESAIEKLTEFGLTIDEVNAIIQ